MADGSNVAGGGARFLTPINEDRVLFNECLRKYGKLPQQIVPFKSTLRSEVILTSQQQLLFNFRSDQANPGMTSIRTSENRLDVNDGFMASSISMYVGIEVTATASAGQLQFQTWPNPATLANGGFGAVPAANMWEVYNGKTSFMVNTVRYMDGLGADAFLRIDTAQGGSATTKPYFQQKDSFVPLTPAANFLGKDKVQFQLDLPDALTFTGEATARVVVGCILRGLRIQNGAEYIIR